MLEPLAERIAALGWHVQLHWLASQIEAHAALLQRLPCTLVFDHMARLADSTDGAGVHQPAFGVVRGLVQQGRAWVKLSGPYLNSRAGLAAGYADCDALAQAWVAEAPQRLVWGSDWPHVTEAAHPPQTPCCWRCCHAGFPMRRCAPACWWTTPPSCTDSIEGAGHASLAAQVFTMEQQETET